MLSVTKRRGRGRDRPPGYLSTKLRLNFENLITSHQFKLFSFEVVIIGWKLLTFLFPFIFLALYYNLSLCDICLMSYRWLHNILEKHPRSSQALAQVRIEITGVGKKQRWDIQLEKYLSREERKVFPWKLLSQTSMKLFTHIPSMSYEQLAHQTLTASTLSFTSHRPFRVNLKPTYTLSS